jgi:magnesium chelatase family protein
MLVAAMNPCPCGYHGTGQRPCVCPPGAVDRYQRRLSGPLRDRFDLSIDLPAVTWADLQGGAVAEATATVRARVVAARSRQIARQGCLNGRLGGRRADQPCRPADRSTEHLLEQAVDRFGLSARAVARILRVARTIADIEGVEALAASHLAEALQFRLHDGQGHSPGPGRLEATSVLHS